MSARIGDQQTSGAVEMQTTGIDKWYSFDGGEFSRRA